MSREKKIEEMASILENAKIDALATIGSMNHGFGVWYARALYEAGCCKIPDNIGDFSDGYHTFNELYHHRAVLFSVICNMFPEKAWKSKLHDTGDMYEGMFIVGIETEQGQATYHYDIETYWDMFKVKELDKAPKWDGHTPSDAIERIGNLPCEGYRKQSEAEWISVEERLPDCEYGAETEALLFRLKTGTVEAGYFGTGGRFRDKYFRCYHHANEGWDAKDVTHWMPMPEPPKGDHHE